LNAENIRILAESNEYVEPRDRPLPPNGPRVVASLPTRALASFANFVVPGLDIANAVGSSSDNSSATARDSSRASPPDTSESRLQSTLTT
jgi:hypothetical protein